MNTTYNGAKTNATSNNSLLDFFFLTGASRGKDITKIMNRALTEDKVKVLQILLYSRDRIDGPGERKLFRDLLHSLVVQKNMIEEYKEGIFNFIVDCGRLDDLWATPQIFYFFQDEVMELFRNGKKGDLIYKWLPRRGRMAKVICSHLGLTRKNYRKKLSSNSVVIEHNLTNKDYSFKYEAVPSLAFTKYGKAFRRNDGERLDYFLEELSKGETKINAKVYPHNLVPKVHRRTIAEDLFYAQWDNLENFLGEDNYIFPVCDTSGSMEGLPLDVCVSLGVYLATKNEGPFKNKWCTFSSAPKIKTIDKPLYKYISEMYNDGDWGGSTNLYSTLELFLELAKEDFTRAPKTLIVFSDMEFDYCGRGTNFTNIKKRFIEAGVPMPQIVFWNLNGRPGNVPVTFNTAGVALVSGFNPAILKTILSGVLTPLGIMEKNILKYNKYINGK